jgi:Domain of unknown function (DUF929)
MAKKQTARRPASAWGRAKTLPQRRRQSSTAKPNGNGHPRPRPTRSRRRSLRRPSPAIFGIGAVVLVVLGLIVWRVASPGTTSTGASRLAPADVVQRAAGVPPFVLEAVGPGNGVRPPERLPAGTAPLTSNGLPRIVYVGADYCPFCAVQRWPLVVALSRFGTFRDLGATSSSSRDAYPNTSTFSFHGSTYSSPYLVFTPDETETRDFKPLETTPADVQQLRAAYDVPP